MRLPRFARNDRLIFSIVNKLRLERIHYEFRLIKVYNG
jgi:hypothetical protein